MHEEPGSAEKWSSGLALSYRCERERRMRGRGELAREREREVEEARVNQVVAWSANKQMRFG